MTEKLIEWVARLVVTSGGRLGLSVGTNVALAIVLLSGGIAQIRYDKEGFSVKPADQDVAERVASLFDQEQPLPGVREALEKRRFFDLTSGNPATEPVVTALAKLETEHALVKELHRRTLANRAPFAPRKRDAVVVVAASESINEGEAAVCDPDDLERMHLLVWTPDRRNGVIVRAVQGISCNRPDATVVALSQKDRAKLEFTDDEARAMADVYVSRPPEPHVPGPATAAAPGAAS
ncbi:MAG: hypothetical protein ACM36B_20010 [Bacteroidota bacterium]|jgi:hypothetical protein